ncbi:MAG TPA: MOSC N-terminal beta barrel domain-containing protein [Methylomirabilota bacterium]|nr:MOSC N-terminal beta barrel domain-containing protein [Methylomirabilota bacterium]
MWIAELWRYPVKSMAGERLEAADVTLKGIVGDRIVHVSGPGGRIITSRTHPRLLALRGSLGPDGEPQVDGRPWDSRESTLAVGAAAEPHARLVRHEGPERFDVLPLLIGTDGAFEQLGVDHRRLRPNIVIGGVDGLAERGWPGSRLRVGDAIVSVAKLRARCVMTTYDPDTQEQDLSVLRRIASEFGGRMALDCAVLRAGRVAVGDPVELLEGGGDA